MTEVKQNAILYRGDDGEFLVTVSDGRVYLNISTASAAEWKLYSKTGSLILTKTLNNGISFESPADPSHGTFIIIIPKEDIATRALGRYEHRGILTMNGKVKTIFTGYIWLKDAES